MNRRCLIVFVKSPETRGVKSRLAEAIGEQKARQLYRRFVQDLLDSLDRGNYCLKIFFYPPDHRPVLVQWLGHSRSYEPQTGDDLGERMKNAFKKCFSDGFETVLLIGSDCPDLPAEIIDEGFASLKGSDVVIGPSLDGGYYLLGFKADTFLPDAFTGISWGTDGVIKNTCEILANNGLSIAVLPSWRDIDTCEDLRALMERHVNTPFAKSRTIQYAMSQNWSRRIKTAGSGIRFRTMRALARPQDGSYPRPRKCPD